MKNPFARFAVLCSAFFALASSPLLGEPVSITEDGFVYNAEHSVADGNDETSPTFLVTHGTLAHNKMEIVVQLSELLLENGYNVLAVNLSYAVSNRPSEFFTCENPQNHTIEGSVAEIALWAEWLRSKKVSTIVAAGHSRGGNQTARFVAEAKPAVFKTVLFAPSTWNFQKTKTNFNEHRPQKLEKILNESQKQIAAGKGGESLGSTPFLYCDRTEVSAETFFSYYRDDPAKNTPELLAQTKKHVLVLAGGKDEVVKNLPEAMKKHAAANPNARLAVIEQADHFFRDLNMDEAVDEILDFIEE